MSRLSGRLTRQYTVGGGFRLPAVSRTDRGLAPLFADQLQGMLVTGYENVIVQIATPSLAAGAAANLSGSQGLQVINGLTVTSTDLGQTHIGNVSMSYPPGLIVGHPQLQIVANQGIPIGGALSSGQSYSGLVLAVATNVFAPGAVSAGTLTLQATVMLLGSALGN